MLHNHLKIALGWLLLASSPAWSQDSPLVASEASTASILDEWAGPWHGSADIGMTFLSGNNNSSTSTFRADAKREEEAYRWLLSGLYSGVRQTNPSSGTATTTSRLYTAAIEHHRFFGETQDFYGYGKGSTRSDVPNGLELRSDAGLGLGHTWRWDEKDSLNFEAGPSVVRENNVGSLAKVTWTGRVALRLEQTLFKTWLLTSKAEHFRSIGNSQDASTTAEVGIRWAFSEHWFAQVTSGISWDGTPAPGFGKEDFRQSLTFGLTF